MKYSTMKFYYVQLREVSSMLLSVGKQRNKRSNEMNKEQWLRGTDGCCPYAIFAPTTQVVLQTFP